MRPSSARNLEAARQLSLSLLYWLQTEAPRPDGGVGYPGLRLRGDVVGGTPDGLAPAPYVRESRRLRAEFTVARAAHRPSAPAGRPGAVRRLGGDRLLPDRSPPSGQRRRLPRPRLLALPDPARRHDPGARREPAARGEEPRRHAHHQRRLPRAPGRMERGRGRRTPGGVLPRARSSRREPSGIGQSCSRSFRRCCGARASSSPGHRSHPCEVLMETEGRRLRIGISGSYGGMNLGDEAILEGILGQLRATVPADVTVFSRNPEDTLARHKVERAISTRSLTRREMVPEIEQLDLFILGGGGILYDRDAEEYLREVCHRARAERARHALRDQRGTADDAGLQTGRARGAQRVAAASHHRARPAGVSAPRGRGRHRRDPPHRGPRVPPRAGRAVRWKR